MAGIGVVLLTAASCSKGESGSEDLAGDEDIGASTTAPDSGDDGSGPSGDGNPGAGTSTTQRKGTATTATSADGGTHPTAPAPGTPTTNGDVAVDTGARGAPGGYARWLLQPARARRIVVEILVQPGAEPKQGTLDHVVGTLREVSGKPVSLSGPVSVPAGDGTADEDEIRTLSDRHGRTAQTSDQAVLRLLFLDGRYPSEDERETVLGIAVRGDTAAVFSQRVRDTSRPLPADALEVAVTTHEVGHLLGLVDLVLHTGRQDPEHPGHSDNEESVMYWAVESSLVFQALDGPPPRDFDADDLRDLAAIRNGG